MIEANFRNVELKMRSFAQLRTAFGKAIAKQRLLETGPTVARAQEVLEAHIAQGRRLIDKRNGNKVKSTLRP